MKDIPTRQLPPPFQTSAGRKNGKTDEKKQKQGASDMERYEELANAIILQAVKDYRKALKVLRFNPGKTAALITKKECEAFFRSAWYGMLTAVDGEMLISALQKEVMK